MNRNKRSLALDLKNPEGIAIIKKLAESADILVENFRGGVFDRLGIGYDALRALNDRLIYVSITGFGPTGPYADRPAYDPIAQGLVGMMHIQGKPFGGKPQLIQSAIVDKTTATTAAGVALAALYARDRPGGTGKGQRVDVPMIDAWAANSLADMMPVDSFMPNDMQDPAPLAVLRTFETTDGFVVGMALQDNHFQGLCQALECTELLERPGMRNMGERVNDFGPWLDAIGEVMKRFSTTGIAGATRCRRCPLRPGQNHSRIRRRPAGEAQPHHLRCGASRKPAPCVTCAIRGTCPKHPPACIAIRPASANTARKCCARPGTVMTRLNAL